MSRPRCSTPDFQVDVHLDSNRLSAFVLLDERHDRLRDPPQAVFVSGTRGENPSGLAAARAARTEHRSSPLTVSPPPIGVADSPRGTVFAFRPKDAAAANHRTCSWAVLYASPRARTHARTHAHTHTRTRAHARTPRGGDASFSCSLLSIGGVGGMSLFSCSLSLGGLTILI